VKPTGRTMRPETSEREEECQTRTTIFPGERSSAAS
jgi:hypothetical protein